jgi:archaellum component FlaF (FlaF/FlaG flagellin family)
MGQSTTVATAFTAIMMIAGVSILITTAVSGFGIIASGITDQTDKTSILVNERLEFTGWKLDDSQTLRLNVSNTGETSLTLRNFDKFDCIVTYIEGGATSSDWLAFSQAASSGDYWKINRVFLNGVQGDQVNPMILTTPISGNWDPQEVLEILMHVDAMNPTIQYVLLSTMNGVMASTDLYSAYEIGSATIISGTRFVDVSHTLGRVPVNIQVTPRDEIAGANFWVSDVDSDSFRVNVGASLPGDAVFYWRIE